jgi:uncharacterized protein (UPF0333 family)
MDMAWFRDLSITILGLVTTIVLIFASILGYRLYRKAKSVLQLAESTMQSAEDIVDLVKDFIKPILPIIAIIQGICGGLGNIGNMFKKEDSE